MNSIRDVTTHGYINYRFLFFLFFSPRAGGSINTKSDLLYCQKELLADLHNNAIAVFLMLQLYISRSKVL